MPQKIANFDDVAGLLRELVAEVRALRADLAGKRDSVRPLKSKDRKAMAAVIPVVSTHFPETFETWEILDAASVADVRGSNLRLVLGKLTARDLGQLFQRTAGHDFNGIQIVREGRGGNGSKWRCSVTGASLPNS